MRKFRLVFLPLVGVISFLLTPVVLKRVIAFGLCGALGASSPGCYLWGNSRVIAAESADRVAQVDIFDNPNAENSNPGNVDIFDNPDVRNDAVPDAVSPPPTSSSQYVRNEFQSPVYVYYINGIKTDNSGYANSVNLISSRLLNGIVDPPIIDLPTQNPTGITLGAGDIVESLRQMLDAPRPDSSLITNKVIEAIKKRDKENEEKAKKSCQDKKRAKFVIIGHSQGNFFLQDIAQKLPQEFANRTVLLSFSPFTNFSRISGKVRSVSSFLRLDDIPVFYDRLLGARIPANLSPLPSVTKNQALDSHSLSNYLGSPTRPEYTSEAQRSLEMARHQLGSMLNFDSGSYEKRENCSETANQPQQPQPSRNRPSFQVSVTANPSQVKVNQPSIIEVSFTDSMCAVESVKLTSKTMTTSAFVNVPSKSSCGGTVQFKSASYRPKRSGCKTEKNHFGVRFSRKKLRAISVRSANILTVTGRKGFGDYGKCYAQVYNLDE